MDADSFDGLARSLTRYASRRGFLGILLASAVANRSPAVSGVARAKPSKGKAKGHKKGKAKGKAKGHGKSGGQGAASGGVPTQGGSGNSAVPAAASLATACSLPTETCDGCCQDGQCLPGADHQSCGHAGTACQNCTAQAMICTGNRECGCDPAGICHRGCAGLGCADGESCAACHQSSGGVLDSCLEGRCCLTAGPCPCEVGGSCAECCSGTCEHGQCRHDCSRMGCPSDGECCPSTGECFSRDQTNCRRSDGSLFQCEAGLVCCQSPDGNVECGRNGRDGCPTGFVQALPATCLEWVVQPGASDGL